MSLRSPHSTRPTLLTYALVACCSIWLGAASAASAGSLPPDQPFASFWFPNELLTWDPATDPDAPFNRSSVPLQSRFTYDATLVDEDGALVAELHGVEHHLRP